MNTNAIFLSNLSYPNPLHVERITYHGPVGCIPGKQGCFDTPKSRQCTLCPEGSKEDMIISVDSEQTPNGFQHPSIRGKQDDLLSMSEGIFENPTADLLSGERLKAFPQVLV
jgi:hypothetical protein